MQVQESPGQLETQQELFSCFINSKGSDRLSKCSYCAYMGFYDVQFKGNSFSLPRDFDSYVMENVLFKISFPAEFHAQTAVEAAVTLHDQVKIN